MTPEKVIEDGFRDLFRTRKAFEQAVKLYDQRNNLERADQLNSANVKEAIRLLDNAYDMVSEIYENDME